MGNVTCGFLPKSPATFTPDAGVVGLAAVPPPDPQATANSNGTAAARTASRRMGIPREDDTSASHYLTAVAAKTVTASALAEA
ncbi:hypothetical protein GCM10009677_30330 [Sphaerisporangium rubeum]